MILPRRKFLLAAPAIIAVDRLMKCSALIIPPPKLYYVVRGFDARGQPFSEVVEAGHGIITATRNMFRTVESIEIEHSPHERSPTQC